MKRMLALLLALLLLSALLVLPVAADAPDESTVTFTYDFANGLDDYIDQGNKIQMSYENADGYVTFKAEGDDPYFRFRDGKEPTVTTDKLAYALIKYRTTAAIAAGEFFTNRRSGAQWGGPGTHVTWEYRPDGSWHAALVDASEVWGNTEDSLYAFRLDPLASGAKSGDTIDIAYIKFFATEADALAYAAAAFPDDVVKAPEHTASFLVDGKVIYTVPFAEGDKTLKEPVVPLRPGYTGAWEPYTLGTTDITVNAVYTSTSTETVPPMPEPEPETLPPVTDAPTEPPSAPPATETEPPAADPTPDPKTGCGATLALSPLLLIAALPVLLRRKDRPN